MFLVSRVQWHDTSAGDGNNRAPRQFASGHTGHRRTTTRDVSALDRNQPFGHAHSIAPAFANRFSIQSSAGEPADLVRNAHLKCCALNGSGSVHSIVSRIPAANPRRSISGSATGSSNESNPPHRAAVVAGPGAQLRARFHGIASTFATFNVAHEPRRQDADALNGVAHLH